MLSNALDEPAFQKASMHYDQCFPDFRAPTITSNDPCNGNYTSIFQRIKAVNHFDRMIYYFFNTSTYQHAKHFNFTVCTLYEIVIDLLQKNDLHCNQCNASHESMSRL